MERKLRTTFIVTPTHTYSTSEKLKDSALLVDGTSIPISRSYYKALKDQINNLIPWTKDD